jgi:hypothetical protein
VDLPDEIVYYLLTRNRLHFGQAQGTPFTLPLFTNHLDRQASMETAELILTGDYSTSELSDIQALLLHHCQSKHLDALSLLITEAEFISKFKIWKESTSTLPSGLHLGHYKALVSRNNADLDTDEGKLIEKQRKELISAHVAMINYSLLRSYSYSRWKNVVNVMIEKEPGNSKVHRLRVIHLYEADYNFLLQAKWRGLISHAESNDLLHPGQYGSCPPLAMKVFGKCELLLMEVIVLESRPAAWYGCITVSSSSSLRFFHISLRMARNFFCGLSCLGRL